MGRETSERDPSRGSNSLSPTRPVVAFGTILTVESAFLGWILPVLYLLLVLAGQVGILVLLTRLSRIMPTLQASASNEGPTDCNVSIIIPARNESADLALCLDDLQGQDWSARGGAMEVFVVDGGSTDGTAGVARAHPLRPIVMEEPPLPPGWVGKTWACHQGSLKATGDILLFIDADVRLAPSAVRAVVEKLRSTRADLVTFGGQIVTEGFWERVVMPLFVQFILLYFILVRVDAQDAPPDMANGQFMGFSREGYARCGGHQAVKNSVLEDVHLAQAVRRQGGTVKMFAAPDLVSTRMYVGRAEMVEGVLKSFQGSDLSAAWQFGTGLLIALLFLFPFLTLALGLAGVMAGMWAVASAVLILATALKQVALQRPLGGTPGYGLLYPLGCAVFVTILFRSAWRRRAGGKVFWKGREYSAEG